MSKSLKILKKETRILGLDKCNPLLTTGAIVRGGLFLDGVVSFPTNITARHLADGIRRSKYFPELRLIMIHDRSHSSDLYTLSRFTGLPVIIVTSRSHTDTRPRNSPRSNQIQGWRVTGLDRAMVEKIQTLTHLKGVLPEPVRIAHLLAKLHIFGRFRQDKG